MEQKIYNLIAEAIKDAKMEPTDFGVEHPEDLKNGDYSTNVALFTAQKMKTNPKALAEKIRKHIEKILPPEVERVEVAGAGFINFYLSRQFFSDSIENILNTKDFGNNDIYHDKKIMVEYTDPNPFKPFHIGHLMTNAIGEATARILEASGAQVARANYQGDVGLHVARAIWGLLKEPKLQDKEVYFTVAADNIGKAYAIGSEAYETDESAKKEIDEINKKIYEERDSDKGSEVKEIYDWGFKVTMDAFEELYKMLGTKFDYYFLESVMADLGREIVEENKGKVFEDSDGAVVFKAEAHDPKLHTRVFITSNNLPTYETKELGLTQEKFKTVPDLNLSVVVTAIEQADYMRVVEKALSLIHPEYQHKMLHITHGMMRFASGKMSSRKGNIITGESLIRETIKLVEEKIKDREFTELEKENIAKVVGVAALKYSILKQSTGGDIIYDFEKSISFEGDSGPYLQYSYARANSVLAKAASENILPDFQTLPKEINEVEKLLYRFPEVVARAAHEYQPHYIANFLIELARSFNSFYGNNQIVSKDDKESSYKVALTFAFAAILKKGLHLLGITAPERM